MKAIKTIFIDAKLNVDVTLPEESISKLPKKIAILATVQHLHNIHELAEQLKKHGKEIVAVGQTLGCRADVLKKHDRDVDAFLYVGTGVFHPMYSGMHSLKDIYTYNPVSRVFSMLDKTELEKFRKRTKASLAKFYASKEVGILVSTRSGQQFLNQAMKFREKHKDKNCHIFIFDTLDFSQLENFPFVEVWVNTACPRLVDDWMKFPKPVIYVGDVGVAEISL